MATRIPASKTNAVFLVPRKWQLAFIFATLLSWISWMVLFGIWATASHFASGTWTYQITQTVLPFLWFLGGLWLFWGRYASVMHRVFAATFVGWIGITLFQVASSLENTLRMRFYPPTIAGPSDNSLLTAFGHEWLIMGIGLGLFYGAIAWKKWRRTKV